MGLDMYLEKKTYVGAEYEHRQVKLDIDLSIRGEKVAIDPKKVSYIIERQAYWRKANQIHAWFVRNVQDGEDNCAAYSVSYEKLQELVKLCKKVLKNPELAEELLPPRSGFFFGSTEYDEWYFEGLENTIKQLEGIDPHAEYEYQSSW